METLIFQNKDINSPLGSLKAGLNSFYNVESAKRLKQVLQRFQPDVLHVHNTFPLASPAIFYTAQKAKVPIVMTLHNYRLLCANALLFENNQPCERCVQAPIAWEGILRGCYRGSRLQSAALATMTATHRLMGTWHQRIDAFITLTQFAQSRFTQSALALPPEKMHVKPNFIPDPGISQSTGRQAHFLFVGRLSPEKGILLLLEAAKSGAFQLKIIGAGPLAEEVQAAAQAYPNIEYLGFQDHSVILQAMRQSRALVLPSLCYEGFPVTLLEALATGTPIICAQTGGLPEIIPHEQYGLLFESGSSEDLLRQIRRLLDDNALHERLGQQGREHYLNHYTPEHNYQALMRIYQHVVGVPHE